MWFYVLLHYAIAPKYVPINKSTKLAWRYDFTYYFITPLHLSMRQLTNQQSQLEDVILRITL